eukprot:4958580-Pyramimonas_sp.AAC.1
MYGDKNRGVDRCSDARILNLRGQQDAANGEGLLGGALQACIPHPFNLGRATDLDCRLKVGLGMYSP